jgi:hypothetical protein
MKAPALFESIFSNKLKSSWEVSLRFLVNMKLQKFNGFFRFEFCISNKMEKFFLIFKIFIPFSSIL